MKISVEKFEIEIEPSLFEGAATLVTMLRKMDVEADVEEGKAHYAVKAAIVGALAPLLTQLLESLLTQTSVGKGLSEEAIFRKVGMHPADFDRVPTPTDIQEYIRRRRAAAEGPTKQLEPCVQCNIEGPHEIHADGRVIRCMWCVAGIVPHLRPPTGTLEYMDGPVPSKDPFDPEPAA